MTLHDSVRKTRAENCDRDDLESVFDAIRGLQSTDDPSLNALHDSLMERCEELLRIKTGKAAQDGPCRKGPLDVVPPPPKSEEKRACPKCLTRDEARALRAVSDGIGEPVELDAQEEAAYRAAADKIAAWCDGEP